MTSCIPAEHRQGYRHVEILLNLEPDEGGVSIRHIKALLEAPLPSGIKLTAVAMASHASEDGRNIFPSVERVARLSSKCSRQIKRDLSTLVMMGVLVAETSRVGGRYRTVRYRIDLDALPKWMASSGTASDFDEVRTTNQQTAGGAIAEKSDAEVPVLVLRQPGGSGNNGDSDDTVTGRVSPERVTLVSANRDADVSRSTKNNQEQPLERTAAAPLRRSFDTMSHEPSADGNYRVIVRLAKGLLIRQRGTAFDLAFAIESPEDLIEAVKTECARLSIDYGNNQQVDHNVVHRACTVAWWAKVAGRLKSLETRGPV